MSTLFFTSSSPCNAKFILLVPSKLNGVETIATVTIPNFFATLAIIGRAPVPVPPPKPAVKNNILVFLNSSDIKSILSSAASFPIIGSAPAPKPFVFSKPNCIRL